MPIDLIKSQATAFPVMDPVITVSLEWDHALVGGVPVDADLSVAMLGGATGRLLSDRALVFYNNLLSEDGAIVHKGDAIEGGRMDETEVIEIALGKVHHAVAHLYVFITVYEYAVRDHGLADLPRAMFRVRRGSGGATMFRTMIPPEPLRHPADACLVGRFSRSTTGWTFESLWSPFVEGLADVVTRYGPA